MLVEFFKYQGTGNDFIIIDDRKNIFDLNDNSLISALCERRMGIGADGLILLQNHNELDFNMIYFNSDGIQSSMCGNGGRCIVHFAQLLGIIKDVTNFMAIDGEHKAVINNDNISIKMQDVANIRTLDGGFFLDTGSPHFVKFVDNLIDLDVNVQGKKIRNSKYFKSEGVNVNFVLDDKFTEIRTYERGVESETLSCGTGVVAAAICKHYNNVTEEETISLHSKGGSLVVDFEYLNGIYQNIWLTGDVNLVYAGEFEC